LKIFNQNEWEEKKVNLLYENSSTLRLYLHDGYYDDLFDLQRSNLLEHLDVELAKDASKTTESIESNLFEIDNILQSERWILIIYVAII
jgi:hypothetical protein